MKRTRSQKLHRLALAGSIVLGIGLLANATAHADGKQTYQRLCQSCHGKDGRGNRQKAKALEIDPELLNLGRPAVSHLTRDELRLILLEGKEKMPAYEKKLKPDEIDPVLDYAIELAKKIRGSE